MSNAALITTLAAVIRDVDGAHRLGAAELAEALVSRGVTITDPAEQLYATAVDAGDGTVQPVSTPSRTSTEAEDDLATLLGDDYYRDRRPFIATAPRQIWSPIAPADGSHG
ncbi:hypothetical protein ACNUDN_30655 [Mycobacterium sp. smrl_JER01]|uniref:hypothetical protein n=1 Tax=Mycobacterium sp. smrl_JER01 TaxID=3402633 RepID=UPI003AC6C08A